MHAGARGDSEARALFKRVTSSSSQIRFHDIWEVCSRSRDDVGIPPRTQQPYKDIVQNSRTNQLEVVRFKRVLVMVKSGFLAIILRIL